MRPAWHAITVTQPTNLRDALNATFDERGPALVHIKTDPRALSVPPTLTGEQLRGFAPGMSKIVLNGGAGEVVRIAKTNLRNIPH